MGITVGCQYFKYAVAQFQNGYVESTTAQVIYQNLVRSFFLVKTICQRCSSRLVDDSLYFQTCNFTCILSCLLLGIGEVSRNSDNCLRHFFAQISLCIRLQLGKDHCRNILRRIFLAVDFYSVVFTHVSLDGRNGSVRVGYCLSLCSFTYQSFTILCKTHYRWCSSVTLCICDYDRIATFQHGYATVCCS